MPLIQKGEFTSAAGLNLLWKIECDALTDQDWEAIADVMVPYVKSFRAAFGVPTGGCKLAHYMQKYADPLSSNVLLTDDVWTTGTSMRKFAAEQVTHDSPGLQDHQQEGVLWRVQQWHGLVVFARGKVPWNVVSMFHTDIDQLVGVQR